MDVSGLIDVRPGVRGGKPCFIGTRIAVYDVLEYLASGMTHDDIAADFPELTETRIRAALEFAAMRNDASPRLREAAVRSEPVAAPGGRAGRSEAGVTGDEVDARRP